jgi:hypothetical protein
MQEWEQYIEYYLELLANEERPEDVFFSLIEIPSNQVSKLVAAFRKRTNWPTTARKRLLGIIIEHKNVDAVPLLQKVLFEKDPELWKVALDGLARMGRQDDIEFLSRAEAEFRKCGDTQRGAWVSEVVQDLGGDKKS